MMQAVKAAFLYNYLLSLAVLGWCLAQVIKTGIFLAVNRKFSIERMFGSGGWPSSHSAMVCALLMGTAKKMGVDSPFFAIAFVFAGIVMYDAMGVRRETGNQARVLNRLLRERKAQPKTESPVEELEKQLKEMVGHTPFQVFSGAMLGILIALVIPVF